MKLSRKPSSTARTPGTRHIIALAATLLAGCAEPAHLSYDFGAAYTTAFNAQADLTRASADGLDHPLTGVEAQAIRINAQSESTDQETGQSVYVLE